MPCSVDGCSSPVFARMLCSAHYHRERRHGGLKRVYVSNTGKCQIEGCKNASFSKNLCQAHYTKSQHPLKSIWKILRSRAPGEYPPAWDRFDAFLAAVGERPTDKHQLRRLDHTLPWGAGNMHWLPPVLNDYGDYYTKEQRREYERAWRYQKKFGIDKGRDAILLEEQGGVCAICKGNESHECVSGNVKALAVDHDHATGKFRGFLCTRCNRGLGYMQDDPALLRAGADYIEKHRQAPDKSLLSPAA